MPPTIYLDDDFQSYSIGTNVPFGSWTGGGFLNQIVAGGSIIPGTDRHVQIGVASGIETVPGYLASFSQFVALRFDRGDTVLRFGNSDTPINPTFLLAIHVEPDSTISAFIDTTLLGFSGDDLFFFRGWNFIQVNLVLTDVLVSGVNKVNLNCEIGMNGRSVMSFNVTTGVSSSSLFTGTAAVNRFQFVGAGHYAAYTLTSLQAIVTYPHGGTPKAIVSQASVEVEELPDTAELSITQAAVEADLLPDTAELTISQAVIEIDTKARSGNRAEYIHRRHYPGN